MATVRSTRKANTATAEKEGNMVETVTDSPTSAGAAQDIRANATVPFMVPVELKVKMEMYAKENETTVAQFVRQLVADKLDFELPAIEPRRTYGSLEERKDAQKVKATQRRELVKKLLAAYRESGGILPGLDDDDEDEDEAV